jgi:hypothetical protein
MTISRQQLADVGPAVPRAVRKGTRARLSVVLISMGDAAALAAALGRLVPKCRELDAELIIVRAGEDVSAHNVLHPYPDLTIVSAPADSPLSLLRDRAMRAATGDIITFRLEDEVQDARWLAPFKRHVATVPTVVQPAPPVLRDVGTPMLSLES